MANDRTIPQTNDYRSNWTLSKKALETMFTDSSGSSSSVRYFLHNNAFKDEHQLRQLVEVILYALEQNEKSPNTKIEQTLPHLFSRLYTVEQVRIDPYRSTTKSVVVPKQIAIPILNEYLLEADRERIKNFLAKNPMLDLNIKLSYTDFDESLKQPHRTENIAVESKSEEKPAQHEKPAEDTLVSKQQDTQVAAAKTRPEPPSQNAKPKRQLTQPSSQPTPSLSDQSVFQPKESGRDQQSPGGKPIGFSYAPSQDLKEAFKNKK